MACCVVYSTQPGEIAEDGGERTSPFMKSARHIAQPGVDIRLVFTDVRADVVKWRIALRRRRRPVLLGGWRGGPAVRRRRGYRRRRTQTEPPGSASLPRTFMKWQPQTEQQSHRGFHEVAASLGR